MNSDVFRSLAGVWGWGVCGCGGGGVGGEYSPVVVAPANRNFLKEAEAGRS